MGSWDETCAFSKLPISAGTEIYWLLITQSPYIVDLDGNYTSGVMSDDFWFPRTIPIRGVYDDYGGIEEHEEGLVLKLVLEQLAFDMINDPTEEQPDISMRLVQDWVSSGRLFVDGNVSKRAHRQVTLPPAPAPVAQILVRRDVWDSLCEMPRRYFTDECTVADQMHGVDELLRIAPQLARDTSGIGMLYDRAEPLLKSLYAVAHRQIYGTTVSSHVLRLCRMLADGDTSIDDARPILERVAQFMHVIDILQQLCYTWHPTTLGMQSGELQSHIEFALRCAKLACAEEREALNVLTEESAGDAAIYQERLGKLLKRAP